MKTSACPTRIDHREVTINIYLRGFRAFELGFYRTVSPFHSNCLLRLIRWSFIVPASFCSQFKEVREQTEWANMKAEFVSMKQQLEDQKQLQLTELHNKYMSILEDSKKEIQFIKQRTLLTKEQMEEISAYYYQIKWPHKTLYDWYLKHCEDDEKNSSSEYGK